jgi:hypothetical protein
MESTKLRKPGLQGLPRGVHLCPYNKRQYVVRLGDKHLGTFTNLPEAEEAYDEARAEKRAMRAQQKRDQAVYTRLPWNCTE